MGRMAHECATTTRAKDGRVVVYTGDDSPNEHLYKFISDSHDNLNKGVLYVANLSIIKIEMTTINAFFAFCLLLTIIACKLEKKEDAPSKPDGKAHRDSPYI